jgi:hypothetical protein
MIRSLLCRIFQLVPKESVEGMRRTFTARLNDANQMREEQLLRAIHFKAAADGLYKQVHKLKQARLTPFEELLGAAGRAWTHPKTRHMPVDSRLAQAMATEYQLLEYNRIINESPSLTPRKA